VVEDEEEGAYGFNYKEQYLHRETSATMLQSLLQGVCAQHTTHSGQLSATTVLQQAWKSGHRQGDA
jgi:hypothetical protein